MLLSSKLKAIITVWRCFCSLDRDSKHSRTQWNQCSKH